MGRGLPRRGPMRGTVAPVEEKAARNVGDRLTAWFESQARDLPWRRTGDPYAIWVAEVLLQQTRVEQALPYFERFLSAFPSVGSLARAPEDRVLKVWEGAGYYARARRLREAAQVLVARWEGRLPRSVHELEALPGFGPYTARSVASIAFGLPVVALDANGLRVLSRLFLIRGEGRRRWEKAQALGEAALSSNAPRSFNEGLMELGQRFCHARSPECAPCPLRDLCRARRELTDPGSFPPPRARPPRPTVEAAVGILLRDGRVLVGRRPVGGLLGGLWEFPGGKLEPRESARAAVVREFLEETGLVARVHRRLGTVEHDYSHFHAKLHVFLLSGNGEPRSPDGRRLRWVRPAELSRLALPGATRKMLPWVAAHDPPRGALRLRPGRRHEKR